MASLLAVKLSESDAKSFDASAKFDREFDYTGKPVMLKYPEDIFRNNDTEFKRIINY